MEFIRSEFSLELEPYSSTIEEFKSIVEPLWPDWDYHNFREHGLETCAEFLDLVIYLRQNKHAIPTNVVVAGILSSLEHDLANQDGQPFLHKYMEDRSASIGDGIAKYLGLSKEIIDLKHAATVATRPGAECKSLLDKMIRRADIANFGWDYERFKEKTMRVWSEEQKKCIANGVEPKTFSMWATDIKDFVMDCLLDQDLVLGEFDRDPETGLSIFHVRAFDNFARLRDEMDSPEFVEPQISWVKEIHSAFGPIFQK